MSDANTEIKSRVDAFVTELSALVRRAALQAVEQALGTKGGAVAAAAPARKPGRPRKVVAAAPVAVVEERKAPGRPRGRPAKAAGAAAAAAAAKRKAGEKRTPALLAQVTEQVHNHVKSNPGQGVEQIAKALSTSTKELTLPIRKLLADKKINSKGQKRATRYFPK